MTRSGRSAWIEILTAGAALPRGGAGREEKNASD